MNFWSAFDLISDFRIGHLSRKSRYSIATFFKTSVFELHIVNLWSAFDLLSWLRIHLFARNNWFLKAAFYAIFFENITFKCCPFWIIKVDLIWFQGLGLRVFRGNSNFQKLLVLNLWSASDLVKDFFVSSPFFFKKKLSEASRF